MNIHSMVSRVYNLANQLRHEHSKATSVKNDLLKKLKEANKLDKEYEKEQKKLAALCEVSPEWEFLCDIFDEIAGDHFEVVGALEDKVASVQDTIWDIEAAFDNAHLELDLNIIID